MNKRINMYANVYIHRDTKAEMLKETSAGFFGLTRRLRGSQTENDSHRWKVTSFCISCSPPPFLTPFPHPFSLFLFAHSCILIIAAALCCWFDLSSALHCASFAPFPYFVSPSNFFLPFSAQLSMRNMELPAIHLCSLWCWLKCFALFFPLFFLPFPSTPSKPPPALVLRIYSDVWLSLMSSQRVA